MATIRELIKGKELPLKIRCADLSSEWVMVTHANNTSCLTTDSNGNHNGWLLSSENWELYIEPKKKVKVALYAYRNNSGSYATTMYMYKDDEHFQRMNSSYKIIKRLDFSEIEVYDE